MPLLVFHDRDDAEVPWSDGAAIAGAWPGARLVTTAGLGHRRILRDERVVSQAVAFVKGEPALPDRHHPELVGTSVGAPSTSIGRSPDQASRLRIGE